MFTKNRFLGKPNFSSPYINLKVQIYKGFQFLGMPKNLNIIKNYLNTYTIKKMEDKL